MSKSIAVKHLLKPSENQYGKTLSLFFEQPEEQQKHLNQFKPRPLIATPPQQVIKSH
jgi:hypothetical protein